MSPDGRTLNKPEKGLRCVECGYDVKDLDTIVRLDTSTPADAERTYFECPECGERLLPKISTALKLTYYYT